MQSGAGAIIADGLEEHEGDGQTKIPHACIESNKSYDPGSLSANLRKTGQHSRS